MSAARLLSWLTAAALALALVLALAAAAAWAARRPEFDFHRIEIVGELRHVNRSAIRGAIAGRLEGNFFTMRLGEARAAFEAIPWVAAVSVRRAWPDRLVVHVQERRAVGLWNDGRVLSDGGVLFNANPAEAELDGELVDFSGPAYLAAEAVAKLAAFRAALGSLPATLAAVEISERASWTIRTGAGQTIELGRDDPPGTVARRLAAVAAGYPTVVAQLSGAPMHLDARYNNGFAATKP